MNIVTCATQEIHPLILSLSYSPGKNRQLTILFLLLKYVTCILLQQNCQGTSGMKKESYFCLLHEVLYYQQSLNPPPLDLILQRG